MPRPSETTPLQHQQRRQQQQEQHENYAIARTYCRRTILWRHLGTALLQRSWEFSVVVLLTVVGPKDSLALLAFYGVFVNMTVAIFSPSVGAFVDRANRLTGVVVVTVLQNASVVVCAVCFLVLLFMGLEPMSWGWLACVATIHVGGALNVLFLGISQIQLERDWIVVISHDEEDWLRKITSNLKSIDLGCDLVAPMVISLLQVMSNAIIAVALSAGNLLLIYLQYAALHRIYHLVPALAIKSEHQREEEEEAAWRRAVAGMSSPPPSPSLVGQFCQTLGKFGAHAATYVRQRSFLPGLALAMLYLTVLSFHMVMIAFLLMRGLSVVYVGLAQGVSAAMGILGTVFYEWAASKVGTTKAGILAIWSQVACLIVATAALFFPKSFGHEIEIKGFPPDLAVFMAFVALSRFGLYMFDVAAAQLFQYLVEEKERGVVGGFQRTLESVFELASYGLVFAFPHPNQFPLLAAISFFQTVGAAMIFSLFACRHRGEGLYEGEREGVGFHQDGRGAYVDNLTSPTAHHYPSTSPYGFFPSLKVGRLSTIISVGSSLEEEGGGGGGGGGNGFR